MEIWHLSPKLVAPLAIAAGAIPGTLSRYYLTVLCARWLGTGFPYGTFIINLSGTLLIGFVTTLALAQLISPELHLLLTTGFLGSYTTFSTYALDTVSLARSHSKIHALGYWAGSAIGGALCLEIGIVTARWLL